ncbi:MAG: hypothetical protein HQL49_12600, partial [Gammaproteobacteria bacterium]|nr:hypothetical protein [Gammaproteobacteria bacterium]
MLTLNPQEAFAYTSQCTLPAIEWYEEPQSHLLEPGVAALFVANPIKLTLWLHHDELLRAFLSRWLQRHLGAERVSHIVLGPDDTEESLWFRIHYR